MSASPRPSAPDPEWIQRGAFSLLRGERLISARLPFFSEAFRKAAHNLRGSWSPKLLAWQFPLAKEASLLKSLDRLAEQDPEALGDPAALAPEAPLAPLSPAELIAPRPFPALAIETDERSQMFRARFSYHSELVASVRACPGSRWVKRDSCWDIPISQENAKRLNAINARADAARQLHLRQSAPAAAAERSDPLAFETQEGPFGLRLAFEPDPPAYRLSSHLDLSEPLGAWAILEPLSTRGLLSSPGELSMLISPKLGRYGAKTVLVEPAKRELLSEAIAAIQERIHSLGAPRLLQRSRLPAYSPARFERSLPPKGLAAGDVLALPEKAFLLLPCKAPAAPKAKTTRLERATSIRASSNTVYAWGFELSGQGAREWIARWGVNGLARCAWASEIDLQTLPRYLEALEISDSLNTARRAAPAPALRL